MSRVLVAGSLAYDALYTYDGVLKSELLDTSSGNLSISFAVKEKTVHFGGCAGNIAYNGRLLGENFQIFGIAGHDFEPYEKWLKKNHIDTSAVLRDLQSYTSEATVVTDKKGQQITFFYEGAASRSAQHKKDIHKTLRRLASDIKLAILSPHNRHFILETAHACRDFGIPYFFDPGQTMPTLSKKELLSLMKNSIGLFLNEFELGLLQKILGISEKEIIQMTPLCILTLGEKGSEIFHGNDGIHIPAKKVRKTVDPTGCGDAYRAGFLTVYSRNFPKSSARILTEAGMLGTRLAAACLAQKGTQNHRI